MLSFHKYFNDSLFLNIPSECTAASSFSLQISKPSKSSLKTGTFSNFTPFQVRVVIVKIVRCGIFIVANLRAVFRSLTNFPAAYEGARRGGWGPLMSEVVNLLLPPLFDRVTSENEHICGMRVCQTPGNFSPFEVSQFLECFQEGGRSPWL